MGSPHAQTGHTGINTLGTGASTRFPRSRSLLQGQRSQDHNTMPMHIYSSWVVHRHKQVTLVSMPFNTIDHRIAINLLSNMNLSEETLFWIRDYLSDGKQITRVNNVDSDVHDINCGVPQGSILGPLIFILYINGLPGALGGASTYLYADDTTIVCKGKTYTEVTQKLEVQLSNAHTWLLNHRLTLNVRKTKIMFFGTNSKLSQIDSTTLVTANGNPDIVDQFKYPGIMLDPKLNFSAHANYVCKKVTPKLKTLGRNRCYIGRPTALYLFNSLIAPLFSFNDHVYDSMGKVDANKLQVLHNRCIRVCLKCGKRTPRIEMYQDSQILPLYIQRRIHTCGIVHKALNEESTPYVNNMFNLTGNETGTTTRSEARGDIRIMNTRLGISRGNIAVCGAKYFNDINVEIRGIDSNRAFVRKLTRVAKHSIEPG